MSLETIVRQNQAENIWTKNKKTWTNYKTQTEQTPEQIAEITWGAAGDIDSEIITDTQRSVISQQGTSWDFGYRQDKRYDWSFDPKTISDDPTQFEEENKNQIITKTYWEYARVERDQQIISGTTKLTFKVIERIELSDQQVPNISIGSGYVENRIILNFKTPGPTSQ